MKEFKVDYEKLAKGVAQQLGGSIEPVTLQQFLLEYVSFVQQNRAKKTTEGVMLVRKKLLAYFPSLKKLDSIKLKDAEQFINSIKKTAPLGVYVYLRTLKAMFNKAKQWNYVHTNPFEQVQLKKIQLQKPVYVTEQQFKEIVKHIDSEVVRDLVVTAFYSGCRLGELVNLTWQDVKLKDELLIIGNKNFETKGRKQRVVPLHPKVKEILTKRFPKTIKREKHFVFYKSNGYPFTGDYFSRRFKRACREAGLSEELHFHCLRHGAATTMIMNGAPVPTVQKILGHTNIQTTMVYTHPDIESMKEAVNKLK